MFETVRWQKDLPRWNLSVNPNRAAALRDAIEHRRLLPLDRLITMHAGQIVKGAPEGVETFYAQSWAFAKFLWEADGGKYRASFQKLLRDTADGTVRDPSHSHQRSSRPWNPDGVRPILEVYLSMPLGEIDANIELI
jgi:hypothetical protein